MKPKNNKDIFDQKNITEQQFLDVLDIISKKLIYKFKFGYHDIDDMKQQAAIFALEGLSSYDGKRPLENFLWTHVRNRLFNFKRDNYFRPDNICIGCPFFDPKYKKSTNQCAKYQNKEDCDIYSQWQSRNATKKNLMKPSNIDKESEFKKNDVNILDFINNNHIISIIEDQISIKHRETYLKLKGGAKVCKQDLVKLRDHIKLILQNNNIDMDSV